MPSDKYILIWGGLVLYQPIFFSCKINIVCVVARLAPAFTAFDGYWVINVPPMLIVMPL